MTDYILDSSDYFKVLKTEFKKDLCKWIEPHWVVCIPENISEDIKVTQLLASSQALYTLDASNSSYASELFGSNFEFKIVGKDPRKIQWNEKKGDSTIISDVEIKNEYLTTINEHVVHVLLTACLLPSMIQDDELFLTQIDSFSISSDKLANSFLKRFRSHFPILEDLDEQICFTKKTVLPTCDVDQIQCSLHGLILQAWESLIIRHIPQLQTNSSFQDFLFMALDFYVVSYCHNELWDQITDRCHVVDQTASSRINILKTSQLSPVHLGVAPDFCLPFPAAVVEMAMMNGRSSALERLHCVRDAVEMIEAQTKEANALVCQYTDTDISYSHLTPGDLVSLLVVVLVKSQSSNIVSNIYYLTHYVFSVTDEEHSLWRSLKLLRKCLEQLMKLDVSHLPPVNTPIRKELSLQDLMQINNEVENRFESPRNKTGSQSAVDITALDVQLHQISSMIQQTTQAFSETTLSESNSPSRKSVPVSHSKTQYIVEFLSSIPSTIRASFRRRRSEQRIAFHSTIES